MAEIREALTERDRRQTGVTEGDPNAPSTPENTRSYLDLNPEDSTGVTSMGCLGADAFGNAVAPCGSQSMSSIETTAAPAYTQTPEELAWQEKYGKELEDWIDEGGYGIPDKTKEQMYASQFDMLKAQEAEQIRTQRNMMERRGITNSGYLFASEQEIKSNTTIALAQGMREIQIQDALMKVASFERAMGQVANYMGYLQQQSALEYQPKFATWQNEQQAKLVEWQGELELLKTRMAIAAQMRSTQMQIDAQKQMVSLQHKYNMELAKMQIDADAQASKWAGFGKIAGIIAGIALTSIFKIPFVF